MRSARHERGRFPRCDAGLPSGHVDVAEARAFEITHFTKCGGALTKSIRLLPDGTINADASSCFMRAGTGRRVRISGVAELAQLISGLSSHEAIALGALRLGLPDQVDVVTKSDLNRLNGQAAASLIARTADHIVFRAGEVAFALLDFDSKAMPESVAQRLAELGGFRATISRALPELGNAGSVERLSTSAGLLRGDTCEPIRGSDGVHLFVAVKDGEDIPRFLTTLHARCWLAGLGWMMVGKAGQLLERSIVDRTVAAPERLVFEGSPVLSTPLIQDPEGRRPEVRDGPLLDTLTHCPPLTIVEQAKLRELRAKEANRLASERATAKAGFVSRRTSEIVNRTGLALHQAERIVLCQCEGILLPDLVLPFDDPELRPVTVADVLAEPSRYDGATLADPLEGSDYGPCKAKIMRRPDGSPWIHSFAHGRTIYELRFDARAIAKALANTPTDELPDLFVRLAVGAELEPEEMENLRNQVAGRTGIGKRALSGKLDHAKKESAQRKAQEEQQRRTAERRDPRPQIGAPAADAPWLPQIGVINDVLSASDASEPPMRDIDGFTIQIKVRRLDSMHALTAESANEGDTEDMRLPAPEQPLLSRLGEIEVAELIERHIEYVDDRGRPVHLGQSFVRHFVQRSDGALPLVTAITTLPIVLADGTILSGVGLNRERGIVFRIPPQILAAVPEPTQCNTDEVGDAMQFLTGQWLYDVSASYDGKCVLLAMALTILERLALPERPAFFVTAGQRGGGKTTVLHMVSTAVLGSRAAACAWSSSEEERRKALFSYLGEGVPLMLWDNLPRGTQISCPSIEKALTTEMYSDRVLRESLIRTVPAFSIQAFTGNNIAPRGDLASRSLCTRLAIDRPDPENRTFKHADPIGWTERNHGQILRALYTVLLGNPRLSDSSRMPGRTRFKSWWHLVGSAVEHAARCHSERVEALVAEALNGCRPTSIQFTKLFLDNEAEDEQTLSLSAVLAVLVRKWPQGFKAADAAVLAGAADEEGIAFRASLEVASGKPLASISAVTVSWRLKALTDAPVEVNGGVLALQYAPDDHGGIFRVQRTA